MCCVKNVFVCVSEGRQEKCFDLRFNERGAGNSGRRNDALRGQRHRTRPARLHFSQEALSDASVVGEVQRYAVSDNKKEKKKGYTKTRPLLIPSVT